MFIKNKVMKEYILIGGGTVSELQARVQEHIDTGWLCQGGVSVTTYPNGLVSFYQAMIK